jgi:hypothetical protein
MKPQSSFAEISFNEIRDRVRLRIGLEDTTSSNRLISDALVEAHRNLQSTNNETQKSETLDVIDFKAELPCDYKDFIALAIYPCAETLTPLVYSDYPFDAPIGAMYNTWANRYRIEHGIIKFPTNFEATQVELFYYASYTDGNSVPILSYAHQDYYLYYAQMIYHERKGDLKMAMYFKGRMGTKKLSTIHNENVTDFRLDKQAITATIKSVNPNIGLWYNNIYFQNLTNVANGN